VSEGVCCVQLHTLCTVPSTAFTHSLNNFPIPETPTVSKTMSRDYDTTHISIAVGPHPVNTLETGVWHSVAQCGTLEAGVWHSVAQCGTLEAGVWHTRGRCVAQCGTVVVVEVS
jgi:hypothetical protein